MKESVESAFGKAAGCRFIVGGDVKAADAATLTHVPGVSGILLEEHSYTNFGDILRALEAVADSENDD